MGVGSSANRYACNVKARPAPVTPLPARRDSRQAWARTGARSDVKISAWPRTRSSSTSQGSTTSNLRPDADKDGLDALGPEPCETVPVLDHDRRHLRVRQQPKELPAVPVQRGPDPGDTQGLPGPRRGRGCSPMWLLVLPAGQGLGAGQPATHGCIRHSPPCVCRWRLVDEDQPTDTGRGNGELPFTEPPVRGHPFAIAHPLKFTIASYRLLWSNS